jgi:micrococcal nuclease
MGLLLGLLGGAAFALSKLLGGQRSEPLALPAGSAEPWPRLSSDPAVAAPPIARAVPDPAAPGPTAPVVEEAVVAKVWVAPTGGVCPTTHPVKAKLASKIFHLPGMANYERTNPDRCYADASSAEADGLRPAKR